MNGSFREADDHGMYVGEGERQGERERGRGVERRDICHAQYTGCLLSPSSFLIPPLYFLFPPSSFPLHPPSSSLLPPSSPATCSMDFFCGNSETKSTSFIGYLKVFIGCLFCSNSETKCTSISLSVSQSPSLSVSQCLILASSI